MIFLREVVRREVVRREVVRREVVRREVVARSADLDCRVIQRSSYFSCGKAIGMLIVVRAMIWHSVVLSSIASFVGPVACSAAEPSQESIVKALRFAADTAAKVGQGYAGIPTFLPGGAKESMGVIILDPAVVDFEMKDREDLGLSLKDTLENAWKVQHQINRYILKSDKHKTVYVGGYWSGVKKGRMLKLVLLKHAAGARTDVERAKFENSKNIGMLYFGLCYEKLDAEFFGGFPVGESTKDHFGVVKIRRRYAVAHVNP